MSTCKSCRHWTRTDGIPATVKDYGACGAVYAPSDYATLGDAEQAYIVAASPIMDGDRPLIQLRTGANFGCTLHEARDGNV